MDKYGVETTYNALHQKMLQYIKTIYLGKNRDLRDVCAEELENPDCLSQKPYIEANPAYQVEKGGIFNIPDSEISPELKAFYRRMIDNKLGVFENPYVHQVNAMEAFYSGKDILVATGTGSGKTECFMWPIVGKMFAEANGHPASWKQRGVRALMLYPMNALVSDQMGRLRKMIGDRNGVFESFFSSIQCRRPQFGMYTGRTPYAGPQDPDEDKKLAKTLETNLVNCSDEAKKQLIKLGKYPAKQDVGKFVEKLKKGEHYTSPHDAELLTRKEIQEQCPDILITNYSMLEYMLIRPIEEGIWNETEKWLRADANNKLLFVIDEAHMYRGSSGGEVALLIRRLMNRLGINRDRIQFILTTASVPENDEEGIQQFANDLSSNSDPASKFVVIRGTPEALELDASKEYSATDFSCLNADDFLGNSSEKEKALKKLAGLLGYSPEELDLGNEEVAERWLYDALRKVKPVLRMLQKCRGNATRFSELASSAVTRRIDGGGNGVINSAAPPL